jgi:hypothetical protein
VAGGSPGGGIEYVHCAEALVCHVEAVARQQKSGRIVPRRYREVGVYRGSSDGVVFVDSGTALANEKLCASAL